MSDNPSFLYVVSIHLSRALDEFGMNILAVRRRRRAMLFEEKYDSLQMAKYCKNAKPVFSSYYFGSQVEGTTLPGLGSDTDIVRCCHNYHVLQNYSDWLEGTFNFLMRQEETAPGYCRLQLLCTDKPLPAKYTPHRYYAYDRNGRVLLKNIFKAQTVPKVLVEKHGPAYTESISKIADFDWVEAFKCNSWPNKAERWIKGRIDRKWPKQSLLKAAISDGFFLVPVGYKLSETEELEWRISFSLTERRLMFSMNIIQLKCYVVLKMIMKFLIIPFVGESISSYHCKTALFYCVEATGSEWWMVENLLQGIIKCLSLLLSWVRNEFCPQFIIPESNLFAGKITAQNKRKLVTTLTELIGCNGRFLLLLGLGNMLKLKIGSPPKHVPIIDSTITKRLVGSIEVTKMSSVGGLNQASLMNDPKLNMHSVQKQIRTICGRIRQADKYEQQAIRLHLEFLFCVFGSLSTSISILNKRELSHTALKLFNIGSKHYIPGKLKFASVFCCTDDFEKAQLILRDVEESYRIKEIQAMCGCYNNETLGYIPSTYSFSQQMYELDDEKARSRLFADCVIFSPQEFHCAPKALCYEFFRAVGNDVKNRNPFWDGWMNLAVVDSLPYLFYLQYLAYGNVGKRGQQMCSLRSLEECVRNVNLHMNMSHLETVWHLLGHCMELEGKPNAALGCYTSSLIVRRRNNAANWHIPILIYREIRKESSRV